MRILFLILVTLGSFLQGYAQEGSSFYFTQAQPSNAKALQQFPDELLGDYRSKKDTLLTMMIRKDSIRMRLITPVVIARSELMAQNNWHLRDNLLYGVYPDRPVEVVMKNDTLIFGLEFEQTVFRFCDSMVLKGKDKQFFFSTRSGKGKWTVYLLELKKENEQYSIIWSAVDHETEQNELLIKNSPGYTRKTINGSTIYLLNLNEIQMQAFISGGGFNVPEYYHRVK